MIGIIAITIIVVWFWCAYFLAIPLSKGLNLSQPAMWILLVIIFFIPLAQEITGALVFNLKCFTMSPSKHFIPKDTNYEMLFDSNKKFKWKNYSEWKNIEEKLHGNEKNYDNEESVSVITHYPFEMLLYKKTYKNMKSKAHIRQFEILRAEGSWLNKFFFQWVQYQCFSPGWSVPENLDHLVLE